MPDRGSARAYKQEPVLSQPNPRSGRPSKREPVLSQPHQPREGHPDLRDEDRCNRVKTPANRPGNTHESSHQTHHDRQNESGIHTDAIGVDIAPDDTTVLKEHSNSEKKHVSGEQSDPTKTNNSSSQVTQEGQASSERAQRRQRNRRYRRSRKRKLEKSMEEGQTADNAPSDLTGERPAESRQITASTTYYAIRNGNYDYHGVHTDWDLCVRYLKGTCGATFKSFSTLEEAFEFAHGSGSSGEPAPLKKMKTEVQPRSTSRETEAPPLQESESQSLEETKPSVDLQPPDQGGCPNGQAAGSGQPVEPARSGKGSRPSRRRRSKKKQKSSGKDPSLEDIRPPKDVQPAAETRPPKDVQPTAETQPPKKVQPVEEIRPPKDAQPAEEIRPPKEVQPAEEIRPPKKVQPAEETRAPKEVPRAVEARPPKGAHPAKEVRPPKDVQPAEEIRSPKVFHSVEEIRLQEWKVEPVLLPSYLFSSEDNPAKREQTLIRIEPSNASYYSDCRFRQR